MGLARVGPRDHRPAAPPQHGLLPVVEAAAGGLHERVLAPRLRSAHALAGHRAGRRPAGSGAGLPARGQARRRGRGPGGGRRPAAAGRLAALFLGRRLGAAARRARARRDPPAPRRASRAGARPRLRRRAAAARGVALPVLVRRVICPRGLAPGARRGNSPGARSRAVAGTRVGRLRRPLPRRAPGQDEQGGAPGPAGRQSRAGRRRPRPRAAADPAPRGRCLRPDPGCAAPAFDAALGRGRGGRLDGGRGGDDGPGLCGHRAVRAARGRLAMCARGDRRGMDGRGDRRGDPAGAGARGDRARLRPVRLRACGGGQRQRSGHDRAGRAAGRAPGHDRQPRRPRGGARVQAGDRQPLSHPAGLAPGCLARAGQPATGPAGLSRAEAGAHRLRGQGASAPREDRPAGSASPARGRLGRLGDYRMR